MICTEQEAAGKWCPQVRMLAPSPAENAGAASWNRSPFENDPAHGVGCISSRCMMWVWDGFRENIGSAERTGTCGLINRSGT